MLLPFIGIILSLIITSLVGLIFLSIHPKWELNFFTLFVFVGGAILGSILLSLIYKSFSSYLQSTVAVYGTFITIALGVIVGGISTLHIMKKLLSKK